MAEKQQTSHQIQKQIRRGTRDEDADQAGGGGGGSSDIEEDSAHIIPSQQNYIVVPSVEEAKRKINELIVSQEFPVEFEAVTVASTQVFGVVIARPSGLQNVVRILREAGLQRKAPPSRPPCCSSSVSGPSSATRRKSSNVTPYYLGVHNTSHLSSSSSMASILPEYRLQTTTNGSDGEDVRKYEGEYDGKLFAVHTVGDIGAAVRAQLASIGGAVAYIPGVRVQDRCCQDPYVFKTTSAPPAPPTTSSPTPLLPPHHSAQGRFTFIELFAGIGGFRVALEKIGGRCVFASELTTEARVAYTANYPTTTTYFEDVADTRNCFPQGPPPSTSSSSSTLPTVFFPPAILAGDMTEIPDNQFPPHDLLTAGFPCQSFCKAGNTKGFGDNRGALFFEVIRVIKACKPKAILLENVDNLVVLDEGFAAAMVLAQLSACGYEVTYKVINAKCVVPQSRKRVYIVGHLRTGGTTCTKGDDSASTVVPTPTWCEWSSFKWPDLEGGAPVPPLRTFLDSASGRKNVERDSDREGGSGAEVVSSVVVGAKRPRWHNNEGNGITLASLRLSPSQWKAACSRGGGIGPRIANLNGCARTLISSYKAPSMYSEFVRYSDEDGFVDLASQAGVVVGASSSSSSSSPTTILTPAPCRYYSLLECKRIMGFPEDYRVFTDIVAPAVGYRLLGNAVCPPVVGPIADAVLKAIGI